MRFFNLIILVFFTQSASSQYTSEFNTELENKPLDEYSRVITSYDLWCEILFSTDTLLEYTNVFVLANGEQSALVDSLIKSRPFWEIEPEVKIIGSNFGLDYFTIGNTYPFNLAQLNFKRKLSVEGCFGVPKFDFNNCEFHDGFYIACQTYVVNVISSKIEGRFGVGNVNNGQCANNLNVDSCEIVLSDPNYDIFILRTNSKAEKQHNIYFKNSRVFSNNPLAFLMFNDVGDLTIENCSFEIPVFVQSAELSGFHCKNTAFERITFTTFPSALMFECQWSVLKSVLANDGYHELNYTLEKFDGRSSPLDNIYAYDELIAKYKTIHEIYKSRGDMKSANGCYIEMKDVETRRLLYIYETQGGISNYFAYKLNVWLGKFADYGTNPVKCILYALKVILYFAIFYLLFYSKWDNINNRFMIKRGQSFIHFFKTEQKREELYSDKFKEHLYSFEDFKKNMQEAKGQIPFFFFLFLKPVYWTAKRKIIINEWFYSRLDFTRKSWTSLTKKQKLWLGSFYFTALIFYGLYLLIIKFLTALIISFNSFSSLGFGSLNLQGVARYMAMLEGFMGWLLLSVFSISLFSQIIQG